MLRLMLSLLVVNLKRRIPDPSDAAFMVDDKTNEEDNNKGRLT